MLSAPAEPPLRHDCDGDNREDFDPATYRWKTAYDPDEVVGVFYFGLKRVPAEKHIAPVFGDDPAEVFARIAAINPADLLFTAGLAPGRPAMYVNYGGRDNWNFDAQAESFLWLARQRGFPVDSDRDERGRHALPYFRRGYEAALRWLACHLLPPVEPVADGPSAVPGMTLWDPRRLVMIGRMKPPLFVRPLTDDERAGPPGRPPLPRRLHPPTLPDPPGQRRGPQARADRRAGSAAPPRPSATPSAPSPPRGSPACREKSHRPKSARPELDDAGCERLRALLHRSPRDFGKPTSLWTLDLAAEVAFAEGLTARLVSDETIRQALKRLGVGWKRAKTWITSPDPAYLRKKGRATG